MNYKEVPKLTDNEEELKILIFSYHIWLVLINQIFSYI